MDEKERKELEEAIGHFEAIAHYCRGVGDFNSKHSAYARFLRRLAYYEDCIASGELKWKKQKKETTK